MLGILSLKIERFRAKCDLGCWRVLVGVIRRMMFGVYGMVYPWLWLELTIRSGKGLHVIHRAQNAVTSGLYHFRHRPGCVRRRSTRHYPQTQPGQAVRPGHR